MGYKSKSKQINNNFKIKGLIFDSEEDYNILKNIDNNIDHVVRLVKNGSIDITEVFNNIKKINVKECYYEARGELEGLFINATRSLVYEGTRFQNDFKVGCRFFDKINVKEYCDSDMNN